MAATLGAPLAAVLDECDLSRRRGDGAVQDDVGQFVLDETLIGVVAPKRSIDGSGARPTVAAPSSRNGRIDGPAERSALPG